MFKNYYNVNGLWVILQKLRSAFAYVLCAILTDCLSGGGRLFGFDWFGARGFLGIVNI